ncbi:glycosyltransferase family 39 protein [Cryobacterium sp. CG_9.6]|uniref:glycosyltransferase family 39 protein n=1 Tax=Cryobacterium sp. CG_9.6 TaxID=2760710 RepID=UPI0024752022|nr:glycosyltransferase family 39 protein [Cryobacterium sp. CG_9.6]MDH6238537.1 mannosyltransferase [Cryobacterium sp. CG_9.6]
MTTLMVPSTASSGLPGAGPVTTRRRAMVAVGFIGFAVSFAGSWVPSYWGDEAASVMSAQRPLASLLPLLDNIDAVHGLYYLFLHGWVSVFGSSELVVRLPSAIAVGVAVAGVYALSRMFVSGPTAIIAALVCAVLPRIQFSGGEARSSAMVTAFAVWGTVLLVLALDQPASKRRLWIGYITLMVVGTYMFLYLLLIVLVHGMYVLWARRGLRSFATSAAVILTLTAPILFAGYNQRGQIEFLSKRPAVSAGSVLVDQWFGNVTLAIVAWTLILVAVIGAFTWRTRRAGRRDTAEQHLVILAALWLAVPTLLLLLASATVMPTYSLRYLSFSAPAAAILIVVGSTFIRVRGRALVGLTVVALLAAPTLVAQRTPWAKGSDWRDVSSYVAAGAEPGDGVVFDASTRPSQRPRLALRLYPDGFAGLVDIELEKPFTARPQLWDLTRTLAESEQDLAALQTVWVINRVGSVADQAGADDRLLQHHGFVAEPTATISQTSIRKFIRVSAAPIPTEVKP